MDGLFIEYRDPLFGIIVFIAFIFSASFIGYTFNLYKEKKARKEYRGLLKRFDLRTLKEEDYVHLYKTYNLPFESIVLLASTFLHQGNYNKAISVYLALLDTVQERLKKEELLELLGSTYFKSGFLQRSKEIFLQILKFSPRNQYALEYLQLIYEKLKEYDKSLEVLESLEELDKDITNEKIYLHTLRLMHDPLLSFEKKSRYLMETLEQNPIVQRLIAEFLLKYNKELFWKNIELFEYTKLYDLLWYLDFNDIDFDRVGSIPKLQELYSAKGYIKDATQSDSFDFNVLITLLKEQSSLKADLMFEFTCQKCKKTFPIFESRCPNCHSIMTLLVHTKLTRKYAHEENLSLQ